MAKRHKEKFLALRKQFLNEMEIAPETDPNWEDLPADAEQFISLSGIFIPISSRFDYEYSCIYKENGAWYFHRQACWHMGAFPHSGAQTCRLVNVTDENVNEYLAFQKADET